MPIPPYYRERWQEFLDGTYADEAGRFQRMTGIQVDAARPPFLSAGDLEATCDAVLSFALAPHSGREYIPGCLKDYYEWRRSYFDTDRMPHRLHAYFARLYLALIGRGTEAAPDARFLHRCGYVTFDMVPYYVPPGAWKVTAWKEGVLAVVREHFRRCLGLLGDRPVRFAVFTGKAWRELLLAPPEGPAPLGGFTEEHDFPLGAATGRTTQRTEIHVGRMRAGGRCFGAAIVPHLIHCIRGLSYEDAAKLGRRVRLLAEPGS